MFSHIWFGGWSFLQVRSWIYHVFYAAGLASVIGVMLLSLQAGIAFGFDDPKARIAPIKRIWMVTPQPRRRPKGSGGGTRSISGAHRNLNEYDVPTRTIAPTAARRTPAVAIHAWRVE